MHLVRLMRMAREIVTEGRVLVRRPDAEELKAIRFHGAWSYERLVEWARGQDAELTALLPQSKVPRQPNRKEIERVCLELTERYLNQDPEG
jgi:hypothetical protein